jgi:quercetin dioxygenase-like cupin family protein
VPGAGLPGGDTVCLTSVFGHGCQDALDAPGAGDPRPLCHCAAQPSAACSRASPPMKASPSSLRGLAAALFLGLTSAGFAMSGEMPGAQLHQSDGIKWKAGPGSLEQGAQFAVLEGDPAKEGPFVMRIKVPHGFQIRPHTHPKVERVTVISGTFVLAMGEKLDRAHAVALKSGAYGYWQPGMVHTAWAEGETVVQLHGIGPWIINYVNPADDPRLRK